MKTTDGQVITAVPADIATGKLRSGNVDAASTACRLELSVPLASIAEWGVQSIDGAKAVSAFAKADASGVFAIESDANTEVEYFNIQGIRVANPQNGIFIRRQGDKVEKVMVR